MLPEDIARSHAYLTKLLETCAQLPFYDVARTLRYAFEQERKKGYSALEDFMYRLPGYIERHLGTEVQEKLKASDGLLHSLRGSLRLMASKPENWMFWGVSDLPRLINRRETLLKQQLDDVRTDSLEHLEDQQRLLRLNIIINAVEQLEQGGGLAVNANELDTKANISASLLDIDISTCPLTGLRTRGRARLETAHGGYVLYSFKPIGKASFTRDALKSLVAVFASCGQAFTNYAGLCRQAYELDQKIPVFSNLPQEHSEGEPTSFEEKRMCFLRLLYEAGGSEYRERDLYIEEDFPLAFAKDSAEFTRILKSLIEENLVQFNKPDDTLNDWPRGIRTHYYGVLPTREGMQLAARESATPAITIAEILTAEPASLAHLHPTIQQVAGKLFADGHRPQAIQSACTVLEKAIQQKGGQSASVTGTTLIGRVFHKDTPALWLSDDQGEREGYGLLYRGLLQAIRNHYAHNLTPIPEARALEWLGFISALFYKLDEAQPTATPPAPHPPTAGTGPLDQS